MKIDGLDIFIGKPQSLSLLPDLQLEEGRQVAAKIVDVTAGEVLLEIGGRSLSAKIEGNPPQLVPGSLLTVRVGSDLQGRILLKIVNSQGEQPVGDQTPQLGRGAFISSAGAETLHTSNPMPQPLASPTFSTSDSPISQAIITALVENGLPPQPENVAKIDRLLQIFASKYQLQLEPRAVAFAMAQKWPVNSGSLLTTWLLQDRNLRNTLWNSLQETEAEIPAVEEFLAALTVDSNPEANSIKSRLNSISLRKPIQQVSVPKAVRQPDETQPQSNEIHAFGDDKGLESQAKTFVSSTDKPAVEITAFPTSSGDTPSSTFLNSQDAVFTAVSDTVSNLESDDVCHIDPKSSEPAILEFTIPAQGKEVISDPNRPETAVEHHFLGQGAAGEIRLLEEPASEKLNDSQLGNAAGIKSAGSDTSPDLTPSLFQTSNEAETEISSKDPVHPGLRPESGEKSQELDLVSTFVTKETGNNVSQCREFQTNQGHSNLAQLNRYSEGKETGMSNPRPDQKNLAFEQSVWFENEQADWNDIGRGDKPSHLKEAAVIKEAAAVKMMALLEQSINLQKATPSQGTAALYNAIPFVIRDSRDNLHETLLEWRSQPDENGRNGTVQYVTMTVPTENLGEIRFALTLDQGARIHFRVGSEEVRQLIAQHAGVLQNEIGRTASVTVSVGEAVTPEPLWNGVDIRI